jgi:two-component system sensor histidine kinase KdpD
MADFDDERPSPDDLLASLKASEEKSKRGKLKIFFGMCAGVGKTYTMLEAATSKRITAVKLPVWPMVLK